MEQIKTPSKTPSKTKENPQPSGVFNEGGNVGSSGYKKVDTLDDVLKTDNSVMTYAVIRGRVNTLVRIRNKNGRLYVSIVTMAGNRPINSISIYKLPRLLVCLNDLLEEIKPLIRTESRKSRAKVY